MFGDTCSVGIGEDRSRPGGHFSVTATAGTIRLARRAHTNRMTEPSPEPDPLPSGLWLPALVRR